MRRAGVLFEVLLSIAIFTGAALFTLRAVGDGIERLDRQRREARALDLARTAIALLEAGLVDPADLREADPEVIGEALGDPVQSYDEIPAVEWRIDAETQPSEFGGLSLLVVTVTQEAADGFAPDGFERPGARAGVSVTLRQLIRLSPVNAEPYQHDEMVADLLEQGSDFW